MNCFCLHTTVMLTECYINRQPGRGYHYSVTNACGESAASKNSMIALAASIKELPELYMGHYQKMEESVSLLIFSRPRPPLCCFSVNNT